MKFYDYVEQLRLRRSREKRKEDILNDVNVERGEGLTSPTTSSTIEEARMLMEYIEKANMFHISRLAQSKGKDLKLRKFFKSKRYQHVEIYLKWGTDPVYIEGKVSAIGRDFVMVTKLNQRMWIHYKAIELANIPFGVPHYAHTHQHIYFENQLRRKLVTEFGKTVARREELKQQFFEETLQTNLNRWRGVWVTVYLNEKEKRLGKVVSSQVNELTISLFGKTESINLTEIQYVETIRILHLFRR